MWRKIIITFICIFFLISSYLFADGKVKVTTLTDYEPVCFNKKGKSGSYEIIKPGSDSTFFTGIGFDILKESYHAMGYTIELYISPWKRGVYMVEKGKIDLTFPAVKSLKREEKYYFSKELSYPSSKFIFYVNENKKYLHSNSLELFKGKIIGAIDGYSYGKKWEKYKKNDFFISWEIKNMEQGFELLKRDRLDAVVCYELACDYYLNNSRFKNKFIKLPHFDSTKSYLMGMKNKKTKKLLNIFDKGKEKIRKNGLLNQIYKKWGVDLK